MREYGNSHKQNSGFATRNLLDLIDLTMLSRRFNQVAAVIMLMLAAYLRPAEDPVQPSRVHAPCTLNPHPEQRHLKNRSGKRDDNAGQPDNSFVV